MVSFRWNLVGQWHKKYNMTVLFDVVFVINYLYVFFIHIYISISTSIYLSTCIYPYMMWCSFRYLNHISGKKETYDNHPKQLPCIESPAPVAIAARRPQAVWPSQAEGRDWNVSPLSMTCVWITWEFHWNLSSFCSFATFWIIFDLTFIF